MKKLILILFVSSISTVLFAQEKSDTTENNSASAVDTISTEPTIGGIKIFNFHQQEGTSLAVLLNQKTYNTEVVYVKYGVGDFDKIIIKPDDKEIIFYVINDGSVALSYNDIYKKLVSKFGHETKNNDIISTKYSWDPFGTKIQEDISQGKSKYDRTWILYSKLHKMIVKIEFVDRQDPYELGGGSKISLSIEKINK